MVIVHESEGEASVSVTNTDSQLALLHVTLENIPEDTEPSLVVTPPLARVDPGKSQLVRFILQAQQPLMTQRLKRVIFEGMPTAPSATESRACPRRRDRASEPAGDHSSRRAAPNRTPWTGPDLGP